MGLYAFPRTQNFAKIYQGGNLMIPIVEYFKEILNKKNKQMSWEDKYLAQSVDLYDLERRQKELDYKKSSNFNFRMK
jgi:hypothetical protein